MGGDHGLGKQGVCPMVGYVSKVCLIGCFLSSFSLSGYTNSTGVALQTPKLVLCQATGVALCQVTDSKRVALCQATLILSYTNSTGVSATLIPQEFQLH